MLCSRCLHRLTQSGRSWGLSFTERGKGGGLCVAPGVIDCSCLTLGVCQQQGTAGVAPRPGAAVGDGACCHLRTYLVSLQGSCSHTTAIVQCNISALVAACARCSIRGCMPHSRPHPPTNAAAAASQCGVWACLAGPPRATKRAALVHVLACCLALPSCAGHLSRQGVQPSAGPAQCRGRRCSPHLRGTAWVSQLYQPKCKKLGVWNMSSIHDEAFIVVYLHVAACC